MGLDPTYALLHYQGAFHLWVELWGDDLWFWTEVYYEPHLDIQSDRGFKTFLECVQDYQETQYNEQDTEGIEYDDEYFLSADSISGKGFEGECIPFF